jgi:hypothetical protein
MTNTQKVSLIAAVTVLSALFLPRSSTAQILTQPPPDSVYGVWTGFETYSTSVSLYGKVVDSYSGSGPASLEAVFYGGFASIAIFGTSPDSTAFGFNQFSSDAVGPTSVSGSVDPYPSAGALVTVDFFLTYDSIRSDGQINVGNGTARADFTSIDPHSISPMGDVVTFGTFTAFTSVPEPPSIVHAALAVLVIALAAWIRGFRPRRWAQQA